MKEKTAVASMTGYGRSTGETVSGRVTVEVRSLNHRHLDVAVRTPRSCISLDPEIRNLVREQVARGKVEIFVTLEDRPPDFKVDTERALEVAKVLEEIAKTVGDSVKLEHLLAVGEVVQTREIEVDDELTSGTLRTAADALEEMLKHRCEEGRALAADLRSRMDDLGSISRAIEDKAPEAAIRARRNMIQVLEELDQKGRMDPQRLEMEVAILAQRSDISEEILRLKTHEASFRDTLEKGGVIGRRLDFLIQEMQREINTIGSKSGVPEISEWVVDFKSGLEKVREQVQNIE